MAHLTKESVEAVIIGLKKYRRGLEAQTNNLSARERLKIKERNHETLRSDIVDCASSTPSITLSFTLPSLRKRLQKINEVILRVKETSEYGTCVECQEEISIFRLEKNPLTRKCVCCKNEEEKRDKNRGIGRDKSLVYL